MKNDPKAITAALDAYFRGLSLRDVRDHFAQFYGVRVHETTVLDWVVKCTKAISEYVIALAPQLSETWHADEVFQKMRGGINYKAHYGREAKNIAFLWNVMDRRTRFLVTSKLSKARDVGRAARALIEAAKNAHDSEPDRIFTDGLTSYSEGIAFAPFTKDPEHVARVGIGKPHATNNRIERMNGTQRERFKVQRGKSMQTSMPEGNRIFYNFVRPHMALDGQTPAEAAGIDINLEGNRWMQLIRAAKAASCTANATTTTGEADAQATHRTEPELEMLKNGERVKNQRALDSEFLALSFVFMLIGAAGIFLFSGALTPSGDSCYCIIPSPEPSAAQGTSSIFLVLGLIFFPMGLMKGGLPSLRRTPSTPVGLRQPGGRVISPFQILSVNLFALGVILLVVGIDALLVPAYLIYKNVWFELAGALITGAGAIALTWGLRKPESE